MTDGLLEEVERLRAEVERIGGLNQHLAGLLRESRSAEFVRAIRVAVRAVRRRFPKMTDREVDGAAMAVETMLALIPPADRKEAESRRPSTDTLRAAGLAEREAVVRWLEEQAIDQGRRASAANGTGEKRKEVTHNGACGALSIAATCIKNGDHIEWAKQMEATLD